MPLPIEKREDRKKLGDADTVMVRVGELEEELAHLKAVYDQYFLGVERKPPTDLHDRFKKGLRDLRGTFVRHTGANFRVQGLQAKYLTYDRLWQRTLMEIEAGTYTRHLFKAKRKAEPEKKKTSTLNPDATPPEADPLGAKIEAGPKPPPPPPDDERVAPAAAAIAPLKPVGVPPVSRPSLPTVSAARGESPSLPMVKGSAPVAKDGDLSEKKIRAIYDAYVMAKKRCNEDVSKISVDTLASTLRKQVPELMKQHGAKSVEFKVVIKDGKAILRALPKT